MKIKQEVNGNNNTQIGVNYGDIIETKKVIKHINIIHDEKLYITDGQAKQLRDKINEIADLRSKASNEDKSKCYKYVYNELYNHYDISSYKLLPKEKFEEAIKWLDKQKAYRYRPKLRKADNEEYRKQLYKSIHSKATQLGWSSEELYSFINDYLQPKNLIKSLKEMSDARLKKVYDKLFSKF